MHQADSIRLAAAIKPGGRLTPSRQPGRITSVQFALFMGVLTYLSIFAILRPSPAYENEG
jgi:hypothetical protein